MKEESHIVDFSMIQLYMYVIFRGRKSRTKSNPGIPTGIGGSIPGSRDPEISIDQYNNIGYYRNMQPLIEKNAYTISSAA